MSAPSIQTTGLRRNTLDKYYTKPAIADHCISLVRTHVTIDPADLIVEPSAGNGAFIQQIKTLSANHIFYDLEPDHAEIRQQDFLTLDIVPLQARPTHIIGNPPFGRQSSLAIKFIKKCCKFAKSISFILPRSFKKDSMRKYFAENYHLVHEYEVPEKSFLVNDVERDVPCVFQIWILRPTPRAAIIIVDPLHFKFVTRDESPDISFRRVGINAATISQVVSDKSIQSHYFIKFTNGLSVPANLDKLKNMSFPFNNTVGSKSISKGEVSAKFNSLLA